MTDDNGMKIDLSRYALREEDLEKIDEAVDLHSDIVHHAVEKIVAMNEQSAEQRLIVAQHRKIEQLLAEQQAGAVPEGWQLVPVDATPYMEQAAERYWNERRFKGLSDDPRTWSGVYQAMLAAAPKLRESQ